MGHSQDEKARSRERILEVASRRFREAGLDNLSISDLMKEAGLTHGGFYKHFESREDLIAGVVERAMTDTLKRPAPSLEALVDGYLSPKHRDNPGEGCAITAFAADIGRADRRCRKVFTEKLRSSLNRISNLSQEASEDGSAEAAMVRLSAMVGALTLARAVDDSELSAALMETARNSLKSMFRPVKLRRRGKASISVQE